MFNNNTKLISRGYLKCKTIENVIVICYVVKSVLSFKSTVWALHLIFYTGRTVISTYKVRVSV